MIDCPKCENGLVRGECVIGYWRPEATGQTKCGWVVPTVARCLWCHGVGGLGARLSRANRWRVLAVHEILGAEAAAAEAKRLAGVEAAIA